MIYPNDGNSVITLSTYAVESGAVWCLWVQQYSEGDRIDRLWAGRVKLQEDPIATAELVMNDAVQKLQSTLMQASQAPLF